MHRILSRKLSSESPATERAVALKELSPHTTNQQMYHIPNRVRLDFVSLAGVTNQLIGCYQQCDSIRHHGSETLSTLLVQTTTLSFSDPANSRICAASHDTEFSAAAPSERATSLGDDLAKILHLP
ncbi:uncharacterized protein LOC105423531 [Pogonomyrmex barbatus]|uniref:Uncharacterized protein LOC105423531 n=1 Tax=Pogonomyrmex barbatus TaxID=144034 RepID=A0A6I9VUC1_9HYME|nr:uncharacterized protein LOC105423531 [Pogonomyrmex barbatus]